MKTLKLIVAFIILSAFAIAQNGANIEFKITSSKGMNGVINVKYSEFGSKSEVNMGGMMMVSLIKKDNPDVTYMINDKNKTYSETKRGTASADDNATYTVKKVGTETINGYKCIHAIVSDGKGTMDIWTTKDIPEYNKYADAVNNNKRMGSAKREAALKEAGCDGFPVKTFKKGDEKEGDMTMELTKFEKKSFSKSDFEIPAGYAKSGNGSTAPAGMPPGIKSQEELMKMTPEERAKYAEELKKQYGKGH